MKEKNKSALERYVGEFDLIERDLKDLINMSLSYGLELVEKAISDAREEYIKTKQHIFNFGGLIRTFVEINLNEELL